MTEQSIPSSVSCIVFNPSKSEVLLTKRRDVPIWVLPGGGIDSGELPSLAAKREVYEETGLHVQVIRLIAAYSPINRLAKQTYLFECHTDGAPKLSDETLDAKFFPLTELPKTFFFIHREWLEDALKNLPEPIYRNLDSITYFQLMKQFILHPFYMTRYLLSRLGLPWNSRS